MKRILQNDLIEIHVENAPETVSGGIVVTKKKTHGILKGKVVDVGPDVQDCKAGDIVGFVPYGYSPQQDNDGVLDEVESIDAALHIYLVHEDALRCKFEEKE